jgi:hypothetical protein
VRISVEDEVFEEIKSEVETEQEISIEMSRGNFPKVSSGEQAQRGTYPTTSLLSIMLT